MYRLHAGMGVHHRGCAQQRKLLAVGATGLTVTGGFVFAVLRGGPVDSLYKTFTDALLFGLGIFVAGNGAVHLFESKYGVSTPPPPIPKA